MTRYHQRFLRAAGMAELAVVFAMPPTATASEGVERLKTVPLAVTEFDAYTIEAAGIRNLADVAALTPGLSFFNPFGESLPLPVIRGVVPQDIFADPAVAIFVDGAYVSGRSSLNFSQLDIERIEVVKGPQTALYGRNAFSGAINYVTKSPSDVVEAASEVEAGTGGRQRVMAEASGPLIGDTLTGRLSGQYDYWDGSYDNTLAPDTHIGGYRYRTAQGRLQWTPADSVTVDGGLYYSNDEIDEAPVAALPANCEDEVEQTDTDAQQEPDPRLQNWCGGVPDLAMLPGRLDPDTLQPIPGSTDSHGMSKTAVAGGENREVTRGTLDIQWDAGIGTVSLLAGYTWTEHSSRSDFGRSTGDSMPFLYCNNGTTSGAPPQCNTPQGPDQFQLIPMGFYSHNNGDTAEEFSQEIRFTSPADRRLRYSAGIYYYDVTEKSYPGVIIATTPFPQPFNVPGTQINIPGPVVTGTTLDLGGYLFGGSLTPDGTADPLNRPTAETDTEAWSVFGSLDFDLTGRLQLRGEIRYSVEDQTGFTYPYKRCALDDAGSIPSHQTNYFPFNSPPVEICGDDYYDLRPADPLLGTTTAPCMPNVSQLTNVPLNDGSCTPGHYKQSARSEYVTGRVSLKYQLNNDWMTYGSVAWGEKPGGLQFITANVIFPDGSVAPENIFNAADSEKITAYELGIKGFTANRRIGVDLAVYYNELTDIVLRQLTGISPESGLPFQTLVGFNANSGDVRVFGAELTTDLAITDNLTGRLTASWTDSQLEHARQEAYNLFPSFYTTDPLCVPSAIQALPDPTPGDTSDNTNEAQDQKAAECQQQSGDVSGHTQMRQPEWTASASLGYTRQLAGEWNWYTRADGFYQGRIFVGNDNQSWLPAHTHVNLRLGIASPRCSLEFWVRNLFENDDAIAAFRDVYWTNNDDIQNTAATDPTPAKLDSNFDDFLPYRLSVRYPDLRTYGLVGRIRFGGAER